VVELRIRIRLSSDDVASLDCQILSQYVKLLLQDEAIVSQTALHPGITAERSRLSMTTPIKVLIVDDERLIRNSLELVINAEVDMEVIATSQNGVEAIKDTEQLRPDVVLMDIQMPVMDGITAIKKIRAQDTQVIILILTSFIEDQYVIEGLANGANGFLLKRSQYTQLLQSIRDAMKGQYFLPVEVAARLVTYLHNK
jgi:DNA-binding NarL/FixJ family response regulator